MQITSQRDVRWAKEKLGQSTLTVGRFGCTTTAISMLSDYFNCYRSPLEIAHNAANYTANGLIVWKNLAFAKMEFVRRTYSRNDLAILSAIHDPNTAVLLEVGNGSHWVVALRPTWFGNSFVVADPWDGTKVDVLKRYGNITGAAFFRRK